MSTIHSKRGDENINLEYIPRWPSVNVEFKDLSYSVPGASGKKVILSGISGKFHSGQVTAILGPSGAGKSTLLNILAAFKTSKTSANVLINGKTRCMKTFRKLSRYIMQEDLHHAHLTVHEAMMVSADLKLGKDLTKLQKNEVIEEILELLRLTKTSQTMCQQLSGGERKRLSIALELVDNPPVIFLDEPTTGLDDLSSSQCISLLRRIALGGRTVVCSIHTPSAKILEMFDLVYGIAGGQCVYQGNPSQIVPYMQTIGLTCPLTYNPADFIVDVSCGDYGVEHIDRMIHAIENGRCFDWSLPRDQQFVFNGESEDDKVAVIEQSSQHIDSKQLKCRSSSWDQFRVLYNRRWKQIWRDSRHVKIQIYAAFFLGTLVGCFFEGCGNDATKAMYSLRYQLTVIMFCMFFPLMSVVLRCDFALLKREHFNRWCKLAPYYWAVLLTDAPLLIGLPLIYVAISYPMSGQPLEVMRFGMFLSITVMITLISKSMGLLVGSRFGVTIGIFVGPALLISFFILAMSGFGYGMPPLLKFLTNFSFVRFALEGMFESVYGYDRADSVCPDTEIFCLLADAGYLKNVLGFHDASYLVSMVALSSSLFLFTITAYIVIKMRLSLSVSNDGWINMKIVRIRNWFF